MADVNISYKGETIAQMDSTGSKTLKTGGCYCEGDISVTYTPRGDDSFRHWDVTVTGEVTAAKTYVLQDDWLKAHRADTNLCVAIIPKFPVTHVSDTSGTQGVWLCANSPIMAGTQEALYHSLSAYAAPSGTIIARARKNPLTVQYDIGDVGIDANGRLFVIATAGHPVCPGEYCVIACLM